MQTIIYNFILVFITIISMQNINQINWQTQDEVEVLLNKKPKDVYVLYSADWCKGCISLKKFLNKNYLKLNKEMYFIYKNCTDEAVDGVDTYPRSYIYTTNGNTIMLEGTIKESKIKSLLELN